MHVKLRRLLFTIVFFVILGIFYKITSTSIKRTSTKGRESSKDNGNQNYNLIKKASAKSPKGLNKDKWIIVTSVNEPTEQIRQLAAINEFQLLVVGDTKTNQEWSYEGTIFLSVADQESLGLGIYADIPFKSYTRKNIGYLYAIRNGAKFIYDTDDDNAPLHDLMEYFVLDEFDHGLAFDCENSTRLMNPYAHFGQPLIWPRGYPLSEIHRNHQNQYICGRRKTSTVQQGVVNGDPDVDAIFRLTKTMEHRKVNLTFDASSPSIQYPAFRMAPYNSQSTFFHYRAFWSLYLPTTVSFRLTDIWRSYWAQRLLWLLDDTVTFLGPNALQIRNAHSYLEDYEQEKVMYSQTEALVDFLFQWRCSKAKFFECVVDLSQQMADRQFWEQEEVGKISHWLSDLTESGYTEPEMVSPDTKSDQKNLCGSRSYQNISQMVHEAKSDTRHLNYFSVRYTPKFQKPIDLENYCCHGQPENIYNRYDSLSFFEDLCSRQANFTLTYSRSVFDTPVPDKSFSDIDLLVTFNRDSKEDAIERFHHFYKDHFRNIIFCGPGALSRIMKENRGRFKRFDSFTFIDVNPVDTDTTTTTKTADYYCMTKAIELNYNRQFNKNAGILLVSDDVFIKYWNLGKLDTSKIWFTEKIHIAGGDYQTVLSKAEKLLPPTVAGNLNANRAAGESALSNSTLGVFYVPKSKLTHFHLLSDLFDRKAISLESALRTILGGLALNTEMEVIHGLDSDADAVKKTFETNQLHFTGPVTFGVNDTEQYCETLVQKFWIDCEEIV